jgi:deoxycytidine triphosphate deaminase
MSSPTAERKDNDMDNDNLNVTQTADTAQPEAPKATQPKKPKRVKVMLPIIDEHDMEQFVAVNGESYLIRRGEEVEVPAAVAEVLRLSEMQKREAFRYQQAAIRQGMMGGEM